MSIKLILLQVNINRIRKPTTQKVETSARLSNDPKVPSRLKPLIKESYGIFHGVGKLTDLKVGLYINHEVKPTVQPTRRIPFSLHQTVETESDRLKRLDIIKSARGPTPWVSSIVAFPKPGNPEKIR